MTVREIERELLKLDTRSRAKLAKRLLSSLDDLSDEENERLWIEEAARRQKELENGRAKSRSAREVLRNVRAKLR